MIQTGDSLEHPTTRLRLVFRKTAQETAGEAVVFEAFLPPNGRRALAHVHPAQEERVQVLRGSIGARIGSDTTVAGPGDELKVPAGTAHRLWNAGDGTAHLVCELRPALRLESLVEALFALAAGGRANRRNVRYLLGVATIAAAHSDTVRLPFPPATVQRIALGLCGAAGKAIGYRPAGALRLADHKQPEGGNQ